MKLLYIGSRLSKHGYNPTGIEFIGGLLEEFATVYYASDRLNTLLRLLDMLSSIFIYARRVDFILIDTYSTTGFIYARFSGLLARFLRIPYIPILHGGNLPALLSKEKKSTFSFFREAHTIVSPSDYLLSAFKKRGINVELIPNPIPIEDYSFKKRDSFAFRLLFVRSFAEIYNPQMAIEVVRLLVSRGFNVNLVMVGPDKDGSLERCSHLASQLGLSDRIEFTGGLSKHEWWSLSESCDIFINTTNIDNLPVSVIEAMALGLVVVSTDVGGMPYLIRDRKNGFLVPPNDAESMARAVEYAVKNQEIVKRVVVQARNDAEKYDQHNVVRLWKEVLGFKSVG